VINVGASEHQYSKVPNQDHSGIKKKKKKTENTLEGGRGI